MTNLSAPSKGSDSGIGWAMCGEGKWGGVSLTKSGGWSRRVRGASACKGWIRVSKNH